MSSSSKVISIGIAGGSGAGKTTLARSVYNTLDQSDNVAYLIHDDYYKNLSNLTFEERAQQNFDHPDSLDTDLLIQHVRDLKSGKAVQIPQYDFSTHLRKVEVKDVQPKPIVLVEGILIFSNPELVKELDIKVYVDADSDIRLIRRISRDVKERGRTADDVMKQYSETVRPMHNEFVEPSKKAADIIVHSHHGGNPDIALNMIVNHLKCEAGLNE
eukprot:CAMPEP_0203641008 /NCGR_PEP_ID=MMETSP0088-20131115/6361_1 /ASSEMBLY_ACC=CAM_ASM_001087 /TAXON_ID=426623 /ORGANISM="Chaetoceros affinis, Strain CCMP159" /LENGTH=214 /DNA_ID=CAMNT_0050496349 /DNA_START=58 /DNA_END=702 /DNA_ORIENTATION=-